MKTTMRKCWVVEKVVLVGLLLLLLIPSLVAAECKCGGDEEDDGEVHDKKLALKYKLAAIASILVASAIGVSLPVVGRRIPALSPEGSFFFMVKAFAAGVILATGFIHVLPDAFENLTSDKLSKHPWRDFPFCGFVAMVAAIGTLMVDSFATSYFSGRSGEKVTAGHEAGDAEVGPGVVPVHTHATHGHAHGHVSVTDTDSSSQLLRHRVISQVLELGIIVHSVIIGIALGASDTPKTIKPLVAALTFHQFFEGMGLGGCIAQAKFKSQSVAIMALFFSLTTPLGIVIGIGITNRYDEDSPKVLIIEGIFNSASAGILIYMALVDLLAADFMSPRMHKNPKLQFGANTSLLLGAGLMSMLAKWA
ncbi:PREDICTED: zinc transporter 8-like [Ipomoea nil]|uniref:zinc transporter 8-like n=1 Tax=Ipomoea nil TaxID=35883 RepID=UPI00090166FD|nr:PREDICTED: zinc transporter 8-like [Ipomoea nil]